MIRETLTAAQALGGSGGMPQADGCVKKVLKIDYLLLNLAKKSVVISYIFKIDNYCHIPFNACKIRY